MQSRLCGRSWLFWLMLLGDATIININELKSPMACFWSPQSYANVNLDPFLTIINPLLRGAVRRKAVFCRFLRLICGFVC